MTDAVDRQSTALQTSTLGEQLRSIRQGLQAAPARNAILWAAAGMLVVIVATAAGQVMLNRWNKPFYDALQRRDLAAFVHQLTVFAMIAGSLLALNVAQQWLNQRFRIRLREALTLDLIEQWMVPGRAFKLTSAGPIGVNPDQRMQQDAAHLSDLSTDLGVGFVQSAILLASFVGVLWALSSGFVFHVGGRSIEIPGYMVWAAVLYAGSASLLSWLVGRRLIGLNADRYAEEAELRHSLVQVNEHIDATALARGEAQEKVRLANDLSSLLRAVRRIYRAQINLAWVTDTYGWITTVAPILVAAPVYFSGSISFGGLMMAVGAFNQVHSSLRWFINNIGSIADWRATLMRVADFRMALGEIDVMHDQQKRIAFIENENGTMTFENLLIVSPAGCTRLSQDRVEIKAGEHVLVTGDPGAGKTLFFRAVAGLWPWGGGQIGLPAGASMTFIPRTPYFAPGTLREVLGGAADGSQDELLLTALRDAGLERIGPLERATRWDHELSDEEQRMLAFARLAVHKPDWVVIDEALDTLDSESAKRLFALMTKHLPSSAIVNIGRGQHNFEFFPCALGIVKDTKAEPLKPAKVRRGAVEPTPRRTRKSENA